jgi:hypothetical protein
MSCLKGNRLFRSRQRRLPVVVLGLERKLSWQHAEPGVLIRTWTISAFTKTWADTWEAALYFHAD